MTGISERTLRYRLHRLWEYGLCGGRQPYVPKGSAPYHWYPSKLADAVVRGAPLPAGGEKEDPSEQFLAHAAAITGLYVALRQFGPSLEVELLRFARESEGREAFPSRGRDSAIVPDASLILRAGAAQYHAHIEVDLGTMGMSRIAAKLSLYLAYARSGVWRAEHDYVPPLLLLTTTQRRVDAIVNKFRILAAREDRRPRALEDERVIDGFILGVCEQVRDPDIALTEPVWVGRDGDDGLTFTDLVRDPWERWHALDTALRAAAREREAREGRLLGDPETHRRAIHEQAADPRRSPYRKRYPCDEFSHHLYRLSPNERAVLEALIDGDAPMTSLERSAYAWFLRRTQIDSAGMPAALHKGMPLADDEQAAIDELIPLRLDCQRRFVVDQRDKYPMLGRVRRWLRDLDAGVLIDSYEWREREQLIQTEIEQWREHNRSVEAYRAWRDIEARKQRNRLSALKQIAYTFAKAQRDVDERWVRYCAACTALAVPAIDALAGAHWPHLSPRCAFCTSDSSIVSLAAAEQEGLLEYVGGQPTPTRTRTNPTPDRRDQHD